MVAIFIALSDSLVDSGFSQALIQKSQSVTSTDYATVFYVNLLISCLVYVVLFFTAPLIALFYGQPELEPLSKVLFTIVIINALAVVPRSKLSIELNFKKQAVVNFVATLVSFVVTILMTKNGAKYWALVGMMLSKSIVIALLLPIACKWKPTREFSMESLKSMFSFGSKLLVAGLIATISQNLYSLVIGRFLGATQAGYFQQAQSYTSSLSATLNYIVQRVSFPLMTSIKENKEKLVQVYVKVMEIVVFFTFPIFIGLASIAEEFVAVFLGEKWEAIVPIIIVLSFTRLMTPISSLNMNILNARGRSDLFLKVDLIKLPLIIFTLTLAIPYGVVGIALAQLVNVLVSFFINSYYPGRLFKFGAIHQLKKIAPIAGASLIMYLSIHFIELQSSLAQMICKVIVGIIVYFVACHFLKVKAIKEISEILRKPRTV